MKLHKHLCAVASLTLLISTVLDVNAQTIVGTILGTVRDSSGAVIQSSKISITNEATNVEYQAESGAEGEFVAPNLPPGMYTLTAEANGFAKRVVKGVTLLAA